MKYKPITSYSIPILCKYDLGDDFFCHRRILFDLEICAKQYNNDNLITTVISMPTTYIT